MRPIKTTGEVRLDDGELGIPRRATARPAPKYIYKPRRGLNDISVLSSLTMCASLSREGSHPANVDFSLVSIFAVAAVSAAIRPSSGKYRLICTRSCGRCDAAGTRNRRIQCVSQKLA